MTQKQATSLEDIFAGGGEMGALMQALDWSATPIGPVETWSQCLRTAVSICLKSRFPMVIWWGSDLVLLYNDAWRPALGSTKHPQALGRPGREIWSEIWHVIGPQLEGVLATGEATWSDDLLLLVERHGYTEETYYTYSYSPILLETGGVGGVFTAVTETTQRVLGERRLQTLGNLADRAAQAKTAEEACRMAGQTLASNPADIPFALLYLLAPDGKQLLLQESVALQAGTKASPERVELTQAESEPTSWPFAEVVRTGRATVVDNLPERFGLLPSGPWTLPPQQAMVLPLRAAGQNLPAGLLVVGASPCRVLDEDYRNFLEMSAGHIASAIANARACEQKSKPLPFGNPYSFGERYSSRRASPNANGERGASPVPEVVPAPDAVKSQKSKVKSQKSKVKSPNPQSPVLYKARIILAEDKADRGDYVKGLLSQRYEAERDQLQLEIAERKRIEVALRESEERYRAFIEQSSEAIWRFELDEPLPIDRPEDEQIQHFYQYSYLAECNQIMAQMYGYASALEMSGMRLGDLLVRSDSRNIEYLRSFIRSGYRLIDAESCEVDKQGHLKYFLNNLVGVVEEGVLVRAWGIQRDITERKRLEDELRRREQEFSTLVENSPDIIFRLDRNLGYIYVSPVVERVSGIAPQQFLGKTGREMGLPSNVCDLFEATCHEAIATGQVTRVEYSIDGRDYSSRLIPERAPDGAIESLMGITEDITEGKRSQRRVAAQYAISRVLTEATTLAEAVPTLLRSLCESLEWQLGVIWSVDRQANVLRCVNTWHVPSANVEEFVEATQHTTFTPSVGLPGRIWASGQPAWIENIIADDNFPRAAFAARGGLQTAFGFPIWLGNEILGVIECFSDTIQKPDEDLLQMMAAVGSQIGQFMERKQAEEALRQSEERLRVGLKNSPVSVFNQDRELRYTWEYNPEVESDVEDVVGKCDADLLPRDDAEVLTQIKRQVLETGVGAREEVKITIHGRDWYFDLTVEPLRDANNEVIGVTCAAVDISERKQAEIALRQSEARFQRLATNVPGVICRYLLHPDGSDAMPYISPSCRNLFELEPETIQQNVDNLWALLHPEDVNALGDAIALSARTERPLRWESRYVMPSGRLKWIQFVSRPERQTDGSVLWDGLLVDITHFKEAAEEREQLLARERQYANQLRGLTSAALAINSALSVEEVLNVITEQAREIIGAHQSLACMTIDQNWAEATVSISLSQKYAAWRDYQAEPDGSGIYACVCHTNRPMRLTQAELEAHPSWRGFGNEAAKHPLMRGLLAAPLVGRDGRNIGLIQLSDKYVGEFTEQDEAIAVQLAQMASVAIENARLYKAEQQARDEAVSEAARSAAAVEALSVSETRFRMMADGAPVFIWMSGLDGHCTYFNQLWLDFVGQTLEEALTIGWPEGIHPDDKEPCLNTYMRAFNARDRFQIEYRHRRKDGEYRWLLDEGVPLFNPDGSFAGYIGSGIDITERKQAEEALKESEARFRGVVESNLVGILFWDAAGYLTDGNNIAIGMLGYSREELQARQVNWRHITPPEYHRLDSEMLQQIVSTGSCPPFEKEYIRKDGWRVPILLGGALLPGYIDRGVAFMLDITERKQVEASQRLLAEASSVLVSSLDYQTTLSSIARLVVPTLADFCYFDVVTADGKIQRVAWHHRNPAKQEWFNQIQQYVPPQEFENHPVAAVLSSGKAKLVPDVSDAWMQAATTNPEHLQFMRDSQLHSLITVPLIARNRKLGALTLCLETQSRRRYTNADLALAEELAYRAALALDNAQLYHQAQEANRIKDEFLAVLSHELRSPLNPILGWTKLLRSRNFDEKATDRALETIERNAQLQAQLIEDLLDVSRILRGKLVLNVTPVNLVTTIEAALETVRLAAQAKQIQIQTVLDSNVGQVLGDANRLQQVIWNLLSNAVKFTPPGGRVEVRLSAVDGSCFIVHGNEPSTMNNEQLTRNDYAQIQVIDNGKGISPEFLPHVFEYFRQADSTTTRKFGGLGLGLAIVHHLAELHGGCVFADSPGEGLGATFTVRLPLMVAHPEATQEEVQSNRSADLSGLRVLVVDDEADIRELVTFILEQSGAEVTVTASASEALAALNQSVPDVLLSDIGMPEVDGYMLMRQIRTLSPERGGQIPAIALTAYAGEYNQQQALAAGFQLHVAKPVEPDDLVRAIASLVGR